MTCLILKVYHISRREFHYWREPFLGESGANVPSQLPLILFPKRPFRSLVTAESSSRGKSGLTVGFDESRSAEDPKLESLAFVVSVRIVWFRRTIFAPTLDLPDSPSWHRSHPSKWNAVSGPLL